MKKPYWLVAALFIACGAEKPAETWQGTFGNSAATLALSKLENNEVQGELSMADSSWPITGTADSEVQMTLFVLPLVDEETLFATLEAAPAPGYQPAHAVDIIRMDLQESDNTLRGNITAPFSHLQGQARFTR